MKNLFREWLLAGYALLGLGFCLAGACTGEPAPGAGQGSGQGEVFRQSAQDTVTARAARVSEALVGDALYRDAYDELSEQIHKDNVEAWLEAINRAIDMDREANHAGAR